VEAEAEVLVAMAVLALRTAVLALRAAAVEAIMVMVAKLV
jgi:hypothetical protein